MKNKKGFTLTEVVIAVVIITILSALTGPIYKGYVSGVRKSEGYALLGTILSAQQTYYDNTGIYLYSEYSSAGGGSDYGWTCNEEVLGIDARNCKYYTFFAVGHIVEGGTVSDLKKRFAAYVRSNSGHTMRMIYNRSEGGATII